MVLQVLFWILLILTFIAALAPDALSPYLPRARWVIVLILIAILGLRVLGDPVYH